MTPWVPSWLTLTKVHSLSRMHQRTSASGWRLMRNVFGLSPPMMRQKRQKLIRHNLLSSHSWERLTGDRTNLIIMMDQHGRKIPRHIITTSVVLLRLLLKSCVTTSGQYTEREVTPITHQSLTYTGKKRPKS